MTRHTLGVLVLLGGITGTVISGGRTLSFLSKAKRTTGEIVIFEPRLGYKNHYIATIRFQDGNEVRQVELPLRARLYSVGRTVPLIYDPSEPSLARLDNVLNVWTWPIVFFLLGLAGLLPFRAGETRQPPPLRSGKPKGRWAA